MKYKVGDKVRVKTREWYESNREEGGIISLGSCFFCEQMSVFCGVDVVIKEVFDYYYSIEGSSINYAWIDEMFEDEDSGYCIKASDGSYIRNKDGAIRSFRSPSLARLWMEVRSIDWWKVTALGLIVFELLHFLIH